MLSKIRSIIIPIILLCAVSNLYSQNSGSGAFQMEQVLQQERMMGQAATDQLMQKGGTPVGNIVDPEYYYMGPGDMLAVQNLSFLSGQEILMVTPESTVLLPRAGEISIKGMTLQEARQLIIQKMKKMDPNVVAYVSLYKARTVMVTFSGDVITPGTYYLPASYRVSTAMNVVNQLKTSPSSVSMYIIPAMIRTQEQDAEVRKNLAKSRLPEKIKYSQRNISVVHNDGKANTIDIEQARATGDISYDPFIREGDNIIVAYAPVSYPVISVSGAVLRPCVLPFKRGDKASILLKSAGGFAEDVDMNNITLVRGSKQEIKLKVNDDMSIDGEDPVLGPGSAIIAGQLKQDNSSLNGIVSVSGEVQRPGIYVIEPGKTKLRDVIELAGGFTQQAYLPMAYVTRNDRRNVSQFNPRRDIMEKFQYSDLTLEDTIRFQLDMELRKPYVSCDFVKLFGDNNERYNIDISDNDMIVVPSKPTSVYVFGQVNQPGYIPFVQGKSMEYYIMKAGGYAEGAVESRARIIRGKNGVWVDGDNKVLVFAGDEIYVAREPDLPPGVELQKWAAIAGVLGSLAAIINVTFYILNTSN